MLWRWDVRPGGPEVPTWPLSTFCPSKDVPWDAVCVHQTQLEAKPFPDEALRCRRPILSVTEAPWATLFCVWWGTFSPLQPRRAIELA